MKIRSMCPRTAVMTCLVGASFSLPVVSFARQGTNPNMVPAVEQQNETNQQLKQKVLNKSNADQPVAKVDPKEEAAYKAFFEAPDQDPANKIQLGQSFVQQYPSGVYTEAVYGGLVRAYYTKQDWPNFYTAADKALALKADDVDILAMVGWVIPHLINPHDPDASLQLDKAESYEKRALVALATMTMPVGMNDAQFATFKTEKTAEAHSGLGLVGFRRSDFETAVKELQQATQGVANPDPTDLYALGASLFNLKRFTEAADAFSKCAAVPGGLQAVCKQKTDEATKAAGQSK